MGRGEGNIIYQSPWSIGKIYTPGDPSFVGLKEDILFLEIVNFYIFG